ncbi:MAG: DNA-binding protein WhiA [Eubacteriales bacterium]|nr:DNA-binding protein WhiA [Eubacteriales bacterium]
MSFSSEVKDEVRNKYFTSVKKHSKMPNNGIVEKFLEFGHVSDPEKNYHLEFAFQDKVVAGKTLKEINSILDEPLAKETERKGRYIVYLNDAEGICGLLTLLGAHRAVCTFENVRIFKEMRENVQRAVNCETSNIRKTVTASLKQISDIEFIERTLGFDKLPDGLREIAELRLQKPNATLSELAESLASNIGKSGVNHRLRKLSKLADDLRTGEAKE